MRGVFGRPSELTEQNVSVKKGLLTMKLKSILPLCAALAGLMIPTLSKADAPAPTAKALSSTAVVNAQQTYGVFSTKSLAGFIYVTVINGKNVPTDLNLEGSNVLSYWFAQVYTVSVFSNTVDAQSNKHSVLKALMVFTGGQYKEEPAYAEVDITMAPNGAQTIGAQITDYYTGKILFSTGSSVVSGVVKSNVVNSTPPSILQLSLRSGGFQIAL
jgi:hypothetical protein